MVKHPKLPPYEQIYPELVAQVQRWYQPDYDRNNLVAYPAFLADSMKSIGTNPTWPNIRIVRSDFYSVVTIRVINVVSMYRLPIFKIW